MAVKDKSKELAYDWYKDFFNGVALEFWRRAMPPEVTKEEVDFLVEELHVKPGANLLDVPCGNGRHSVELAKLGYNVTGIDICDEFISEARKAAAPYGERARFIKEDMRNIPSDGAYDGGFCFGNSFGYFENVCCEDFIAAFSGALKPGARFVLDTGVVAEVLIPNLKEKDVIQVGDIKMTIDNVYHAESSCLETKYSFSHDSLRQEGRSLHYVFTAGEINRMFAQNGFRLVSMYGSIEKEPFKLGAKRLIVVSEKA